MGAAQALIIALLLQSAVAMDRDGLIREAVDRVRADAYTAATVDWPRVEAEMRTRTEGAQDLTDLLPAYAYLARSLGDRHSFIQPPQDAVEAWERRYPGRSMLLDTPPNPRPATAFSTRARVEGRGLALSSGRSSYLVVVPRMIGGGEPAQAYAVSLYNRLASNPSSCGVVVDLRGNRGGNMWPMLAGLSPLLGDAPIGQMRDASGAFSTYARLREGAAVSVEGSGAEQVVISVPDWRPLPNFVEAPVGVLIDEGVLSSGEAVAVALKGRPNTRFFGQRTGGLASVNHGILMSSGVNMVITVAMMADRQGRVYPEGVPPDVVVPPGEGDRLDPDDAVLEQAKRWLGQQCRPEGAGA